jgi:A/G-specific adenine glycosylase
MMELPSTPWREAPWPAAEAGGNAPLITREWTVLPGLVRHTFTHFHLEMTVWASRVDGAAGTRVGEGRWVALDGLGDEALPSVMRKLVRHALERLAEG